MYPSDEKNQKQYEQLMETIKQLNFEKRGIAGNSYYIKGKKIEKFKKLNFSDKMGKIVSNVKKKAKSRGKQKPFYYMDLETAYNDRSVCNYVSEERIAVYTCIIGTYDSLQEPLIQPDNIDYYAFTDFEIPQDSKWKRIPIDEYETVKEYSPALTNRFFKMHPHLLFPEYKYSIYVDGNIRIYSDLTEHVNRISEVGLSCFRHSRRKCVFEEAEMCQYLGKESSENIQLYLHRLEQKGFQRNKGVLACNFLVREHHKESCIEIMNLWWKEFKNHIKRDQLSLPFVLYQKEIKIEEIATLGGNVHKEYSIEIIPHIVK